MLEGGGSINVFLSPKAEILAGTRQVRENFLKAVSGEMKPRNLLSGLKNRCTLSGGKVVSDLQCGRRASAGGTFRLSRQGGSSPFLRAS